MPSRQATLRGRADSRTATRQHATRPAQIRSAHVLGTRWRWLRSGGFAALAAQIAIAGHSVGGGHAPNPPLLLTLTAALAGATAGLAGSRRSFRQLLLGMTGVQVAFHLLLGWSDHHGPSPEHAERMVAFHAAAAIVGAALLAYGDAALFALVSWFRRLLPTAPALLAVVNRRGPVGAACEKRGQAHRWSPLQRRGPPTTPDSN